MLSLSRALGPARVTPDIDRVHVLLVAFLRGRNQDRERGPRVHRVPALLLLFADSGLWREDRRVLSLGSFDDAAGAGEEQLVGLVGITREPGRVFAVGKGDSGGLCNRMVRAARNLGKTVAVSRAEQNGRSLGRGAGKSGRDRGDVLGLHEELHVLLVAPPLPGPHAQLILRLIHFQVFKIIATHIRTAILKPSCVSR